MRQPDVLFLMPWIRKDSVLYGTVSDPIINLHSASGAARKLQIKKIGTDVSAGNLETAYLNPSGMITLALAAKKKQTGPPGILPVLLISQSGPGYADKYLSIIFFIVDIVDNVN